MHDPPAPLAGSFDNGGRSGSFAPYHRPKLKLERGMDPSAPHAAETKPKINDAPASIIRSETTSDSVNHVGDSLTGGVAEGAGPRNPQINPETLDENDKMATRPGAVATVSAGGRYLKDQKGRSVPRKGSSRYFKEDDASSCNSGVRPGAFAGDSSMCSQHSKLQKGLRASRHGHRLGVSRHGSNDSVASNKTKKQNEEALPTSRGNFKEDDASSCNSGVMPGAFVGDSSTNGQCAKVQKGLGVSRRGSSGSFGLGVTRRGSIRSFASETTEERKEEALSASKGNFKEGNAPSCISEVRPGAFTGDSSVRRQSAKLQKGLGASRHGSNGSIAVKKTGERSEVKLKEDDAASCKSRDSSCRSGVRPGAFAGDSAVCSPYAKVQKGLRASRHGNGLGVSRHSSNGSKKTEKQSEEALPTVAAVDQMHTPCAPKLQIGFEAEDGQPPASQAHLEDQRQSPCMGVSCDKGEVVCLGLEENPVDRLKAGHDDRGGEEEIYVPPEDYQFESFGLIELCEFPEDQTYDTQAGSSLFPVPGSQASDRELKSPRSADPPRTVELPHLPLELIDFLNRTKMTGSPLVDKKKRKKKKFLSGLTNRVVRCLRRAQN